MRPEPKPQLVGILSMNEWILIPGATCRNWSLITVIASEPRAKLPTNGLDPAAGIAFNILLRVWARSDPRCGVAKKYME